MSSQDLTTVPFVLDIQYHTIQGAFVQTVDARGLHDRLGHDRGHFTRWLTSRIEEYGFVREIDYLVFARGGENPSGGHPNYQYVLTLDMAKELCMLERSDIGRRARQYFIACEKALHGGALAKRLESIEGRLSQLEDPGMLAIPQSLQASPSVEPQEPSPHLPPPPHYQVQEMAHVSEMLLAVWTTLRQATEPLTNAEIGHQTRLKIRTVQKHTQYLLQLGLVDMYETFPNHLYMLAEQADKRHAAYYQRLERLAAIMEQRQQRFLRGGGV